MYIYIYIYTQAARFLRILRAGWTSCRNSQPLAANPVRSARRTRFAVTAVPQAMPCADGGTAES